MVEVTAVPLQPIEKGSLLKFWLGMLVGVVLASAVAWYTSLPATVSVDVVTAGEGEFPEESDTVFVEYVGKLEDGTVFDQSPPDPTDIPEQIAHLIPSGAYMELSGVVPGFRDGILQMRKGGVYVLEIPSDMAYGSNPPAGSPIPADADLTFEVTLHDFMSQEELQARALEINTIMEQVLAEEAALEGAETPTE